MLISQRRQPGAGDGCFTTDFAFSGHVCLLYNPVKKVWAGSTAGSLARILDVFDSIANIHKDAALCVLMAE